MSSSGNARKLSSSRARERFRARLSLAFIVNAPVGLVSMLTAPMSIETSPSASIAVTNTAPGLADNPQSNRQMPLLFPFRRIQGIDSLAVYAFRRTGAG